MNNLESMKKYLKSYMSNDTDYLDGTHLDKFTYYADSCDVDPFILRNWLIGRGKPNWNKVKNALDNLGVCYVKAGE